ncbi:alpha/beta fold hydrolase [Bacillus weihaiensis]|uniref:Alpha/beta hydrolase n=1 Tax=Bacillus weihaiensis TaxID=1547283 RepID=A0A1L3MTW1_9BACI|nr:alpha/beta hydrolase [Bacillus weihaiensis]APH05730.1 alpha/beta hydrolase [Bacillus weihaiensis]
MKEAIIFIHGLTGTKRAFKKQMDYFQTKYDTYAYNLLGHGEDRGKPIEFTLHHLVQQLEEFYEENGINEAHICSLSYGCYPSTIFASKYKDKVRSLCYIGGHYNAPSQLFDVLRHHWNVREEEYSKWLKHYTNDIYPKESLIDPYAVISKKIYYKYGLELAENILKNAIEHRLYYDLRRDLKSVTAPILWVMGDHDTLYKSTLKELAEIVPHVIYKEIKHAGHAANLFRPNCFKELYEGFLMQFQLEGAIS